MLVPPAPGALGESARAALLVALLAVVVGVLIAWVVTSTGRRRQRQALPPDAPSVPAPPPLQAPPDDEPPSSVLGPYVNNVAAQKRPPPIVDADAIHLNTASYEELRQVDGIDPVLAARILAHRRANGEFETLDELRKVTGLAPERLEASDGRRVVL